MSRVLCAEKEAYTAEVRCQLNRGIKTSLIKRNKMFQAKLYLASRHRYEFCEAGKPTGHFKGMFGWEAKQYNDAFDQAFIADVRDGKQAVNRHWKHLEVLPGSTPEADKIKEQMAEIKFESIKAKFRSKAKRQGEIESRIKKLEKKYS